MDLLWVLMVLGGFSLVVSALGRLCFKSPEEEENFPDYPHLYDEEDLSDAIFADEARRRDEEVDWG